MQFYMSSTLKGVKAKTHFHVRGKKAVFGGHQDPSADPSDLTLWTPDLADVAAKVSKRHRKAIERINVVWCDKLCPRTPSHAAAYDRKGRWIGNLYFNPVKEE